MAKLKLKQKEWFTISGAANYLTDATEGRSVTETDVIQFLSDGDLEASIYFSERKYIDRDKFELASDNRRISFTEMSKGLEFDRDLND